jgi:hypothetical protein
VRGREGGGVCIWGAVRETGQALAAAAASSTSSCALSKTAGTHNLSEPEPHLLCLVLHHTLLLAVVSLSPQAAATVRHLMLPAHWTQRTSLVTDLVACYGCGGRSIVFTETKNDANELAASLSEVMGAR